MASPLDTLIRKEIKKGFKGKLLAGTLRRITASVLDTYGDPSTAAATTYTFNGFRDSFSAVYRAAAQIPETDVRVFIIGGSITVEPVKGDQVSVARVGETTPKWYEVRAVLGVDPANASYDLQCFEIDDPT